MKFNKKVAAGLAAGAVAVATSGVAYAYFTGADGTGSGTATVGSSTQWGVSALSFTGDLYPSKSSDATRPEATSSFTVTNNGSGYQNLASVDATVDEDATTHEALDGAGHAITGCLAAWFSPSVVPDSGATLGEQAPGATYTGDVVLVMDDVNSSQDDCQTATPRVTLTASS